MLQIFSAHTHLLEDLICEILVSESVLAREVGCTDTQSPNHPRKMNKTLLPLLPSPSSSKLSLTLLGLLTALSPALQAQTQVLVNVTGDTSVSSVFLNHNLTTANRGVLLLDGATGTPVYTITGPQVFADGATGSSNNLAGLFSSGVDIDITGNVTSANVGTSRLVLGSTTTGNAISGIISNNGVGTTGITITGPGAWQFSNNNTYTGRTAINSGTLELAYTNALSNILADSSQLQLGGKLKFTGATDVANTETIGALFMATGAGSVETTSAGSGSMAVTFASLSNNNNGRSSTLNFNIESGDTVTVTGATANSNAGGNIFVNNGQDFAAYNASKEVVAFSGYTTLTINNDGGGSTYFSLTGGMVRDFRDNTKFQGLKLTSNADNQELNLTGGVMKMDGGGGTGGSGVLYTGGDGTNKTYTIKNGTLQANSGGNGNAFFIAEGAKLIIDSTTALTTSDANANLAKAGTGELSIVGAKAWTGSVSLLEGVYSVDSLVTVDGTGQNSGLGFATTITNTPGRILMNGGTLRYTGGATTTNRAFSIGSAGATIEANGTGALIWTPTSITYTNGQGDGSQFNNFQNTFITLSGTNTDNNTFATPIANQGSGVLTSLNKTGTGRWVLSGNHSYGGPTIVSAGTLVVSGTLTGSTLVSVASGATLAGAGTINGATTIAAGGIISPGNSPGNMTLANGLTLNGSYEWELGALSTSGPGTNFDALTITGGNVDLTGATIDLTLGSFAPSANAFWTTDQTWSGILDNTGGGTLTGTFAAIDNSAWSSYGAFSTTYTGNDVNLVWTAVPEPTTAGLLAFGLAGAFVLRRRR